MANQGSGFGGFPGAGADFEQLARQYWGAWGEMLRNVASGVSPPDPQQIGMRAWQDSVAWWTQQAQGRPAHDDTLSRFNRQAGDWYAQMQQVAAQFAGTGGSAAEVAGAWKQALGGGAINVFADMLKSMAGNGLHGVEQWSEDAAPLLRAWRLEGASWLDLPAFGHTREHQERLQSLAQAQLQAQEASNAFNTLLLKASDAAFGVFERMLAEREAPERQITSPRALFDLWIDAAEQAYAEVALSKDYRTSYGELVNAQMRLRAGVQKEVELASAALGMPTRSELDGAHRKIVELERALRRVRDAAGAAPPATPDGRSGKKPVGKAAKKNAMKSAKTAGKSSKAAAGKAERQAVQDAPAAKPSSKPPARKRAVKNAAGKPSVSAAPEGARRGRLPTNGFSTMIPVAPVPLAPGGDA